MKKKDLREKYYQSTETLSNINRQLALAGIAIVWFFANPKVLSSCPSIKLGNFVIPFFLFTLSLGFDLLQYIFSSLIYGCFNRKKEKQGISSNEDFGAPPYLNWSSLICFILKVSCTVLAYFAFGFIVFKGTVILDFTEFFKFKEFWNTLAGGFFVLLGTLLAYYFQRKTKNEDHEEKIKNLLIATSVELDCLTGKAKEVVANLFIPNDENLETIPFFQFSMFENYFTVYDNNTSEIGNISNQSLRNDLVKTYINLKSFADNLRLYKENIDQYYHSFLLPIETESQKIIQKAANKVNKQILIGTAETLKIKFVNLTKEVTNLKLDIKNFLE